jgi:predicted CoA-binding protein
MPNKAEFFDSNSFVLYGVSPKRTTFAESIKKELENRGRKVYPIDRSGKIGYKDIYSLPDKTDRAIVALGRANSPSIIDELVGGGIKQVWLQFGAYNKEIIERFRKNGIETHTGCVLMYTPDTALFHRVHKFFHELIGKDK